MTAVTDNSRTSVVLRAGAVSSYTIEYQAGLVEEAVLRFIVGHPEEDLFRRQRDPIYALPGEEEREVAFQTLHQCWFEHLGLSRPLVQALAEQPLLTTATHRCMVTQAQSNKEVGVDLYRSRSEPGGPGAQRDSILIRITAELLCQPQRLLAFLRHEMTHVADMLDPDFGYDPAFPRAEAGPAFDHLLQQRYGLVWDLTIDGRLVRRGWLPRSVRARRLEEFRSMFPGSEIEQKRVFNHFFDRPSPTHQEILSFVRDPHSWLSGRSRDGMSAGRCSLCHFPSHDLVLNIDPRCPELIASIRRDYPDWMPGQPVCRQCVDLFLSREWAAAE